MNSYAIYRIAETLRVLGFVTLVILLFNFFPVTAIMIVLLALLNDGSILSIAYDNVQYKDQPEAWNMRLVLGISSVLGLVGPIAALGLFYLGYKVIDLSRPEVQTMMYLMLSVAGSMTIYLTRTRGPFWSIRPARKLVIAVTGAQIIATVISIGGIFVTALPWKYALLVWGYALVWFLVTDRIKLLAYRLLDPHASATSSTAPAGTPSTTPTKPARTANRNVERAIHPAAMIRHKQRTRTSGNDEPAKASPEADSSNTSADRQPARSPTPWPHSRAEAEAREIIHALSGNHVLTVAQIKELCWASHWPESDFTTTLQHAIAAGEIKQLSEDQYEIPESHRHNP
jgi:H+-transporting ATPase